MSEIALQLEYSVEADVSPDFRVAVPDRRSELERSTCQFRTRRSFRSGLMRNNSVAGPRASALAHPGGSARLSHSSLNCNSTGRCSPSNGVLTICLDAGRN